MEATLELPTGRLIVGDPGTLFGDAAPLDLELPPGRWPVAATARGIERRYELRLGTAAPVRWAEAGPGFATPSGHLCLLDAAALEQFTDLGDEPVDEYELLAEQLAAHPGEPVTYRGLLVLPAANAVHSVRAGYDGEGRVIRVVARF